MHGLASHRRRVLGPSYLGQDQGELITSKPRHGIAGAHAGVEPAGDFDQEPVPSRVAEHIVDVLEVVEVEQQQPGSPIMALGLSQSMLQAVVEQRPVGQAGQRIVEGEITGALLDPRAFGDVPANPRKANHRAVRILDRRQAECDLEPPAILGDALGV